VLTWSFRLPKPFPDALGRSLRGLRRRPRLAGLPSPGDPASFKRRLAFRRETYEGARFDLFLRAPNASGAELVAHRHCRANFDAGDGKARRSRLLGRWSRRRVRRLLRETSPVF